MTAASHALYKQGSIPGTNFDNSLQGSTIYKLVHEQLNGIVGRRGMLGMRTWLNRRGSGDIGENWRRDEEEIVVKEGK